MPDNKKDALRKEDLRRLVEFDTEALQLYADTCEAVARDIEGYLDEEWDGNEEGWQALVKRLRSHSMPHHAHEAVKNHKRLRKASQTLYEETIKALEHLRYAAEFKNLHDAANDVLQVLVRIPETYP